MPNSDLCVLGQPLFSPHGLPLATPDPASREGSPSTTPSFFQALAPRCQVLVSLLRRGCHFTADGPGIVQLPDSQRSSLRWGQGRLQVIQRPLYGPTMQQQQRLLLVPRQAKHKPSPLNQPLGSHHPNRTGKSPWARTSSSTASPPRRCSPRCRLPMPSSPAPARPRCTRA